MPKSRPILFSPMMVEAIIAGRKNMTRRVLKAGFDADKMEYVKVERFLVDIPEAVALGTQAYFDPDDGGEWLCGCKCPFGSVGDWLWVKESYYEFGCWVYGAKEKGRFSFVGSGNVRYLDNKPEEVKKGYLANDYGWYKRPSLFMPRKASRILLEITDIRVERLLDISEEDAVAEGVETDEWTWGPMAFPDGTIDYTIVGTKSKFHRDYSKPGKQWSNFPAVNSFHSLWDAINGDGAWELNPWVWVVCFRRKEVGDE
jgi:hypothetical protein